MATHQISVSFLITITRFIIIYLLLPARTYPSTGTFTPAQAELYTALLSAQKALCTYCTEASGLSLYDLHRKSCQLLKRELNQIGFGLQTGDLENVLYPHFLSHPIGVDLHESSSIDRSGRWEFLCYTLEFLKRLKPSSLKEGMVITIEPGLHIYLLFAERHPLTSRLSNDRNLCPSFEGFPKALPQYGHSYRGQFLPFSYLLVYWL